MQVGVINSNVIYNRPYLGTKSEADKSTVSNTYQEHHFEFPDNEFYNATRSTFSCHYTQPNLSREEIIAQRKVRKAQKKLDKKARYEYRESLKSLQGPSTIDEEAKTIDILAKAMYPANILSNYNRDEKPFYVDGVPCHSLEGFLQSLKIPDREVQEELCLKSGATSRHLGRMLAKKYNWKENQTLYWQGKPYQRDSKEYIDLVKKAYRARFDHSTKFRNALFDSRGYTLTHTCGCDDKTQTVLTTDEFLGILNELRDELLDF